MIVLTMLRSLAARLWSYPVTRYALIVAVAAASGFVYGRYLRPPRVEVRTETRTEVQVVEKVVERVVTKTVTASARRGRVRVTERSTTTPDGTVTKERVAERDTEATTDSVTKSVEDKSLSRTESERATSVSLTNVSRPPDWRISALGGVLLTQPAVGGLQVAPMFGASVERRIAGPFFVGAQGMVARDGRQGYVGLTLGAAF